MNPNQITFESENLRVDYIRFKFQHLETANKKQIAQDLLQLGFNSYQESGKLAKPSQEPFLMKSKNTFEVYFVEDNTDWNGVVFNISGKNAAQFYLLWKEKLINKTIFSEGILSRLDLCYDRFKNPNDKLLVSDFLYQALEELKRTEQKVSFEKNSKGSILKIGNRGSDLFFRIYEAKTSIRFEQEMKGRFIQKYHSFLVNDELEQFEYQLSSHFLTYSAKILPLNLEYLDWLVMKLRPTRIQQIPRSHLNSHYYYENSFQSFSDRKDFLQLLQFLSYAKTLTPTPGWLGTTQFRQVSFSLQDFLRYQNLTERGKSYNYYQVKKLLTFFDKLQKNSLIKIFQNSSFRSLVSIPEVKMEKSKTNSWTIKVWIAEELFYYAYPFLLPNILSQNPSKDEVEVYFHLLQVFSSPNVEKKFLIGDFLDSYSSVLSNQRRTKIKELFLKLVDSLQEHHLIEPKYQVYLDGNWQSVSKLNVSNISTGFILFEKLSIGSDKTIDW